MNLEVTKKVLKGIKKYITLLIILSISISYFSIQIAIYVKYAIDGIIFQNQEIPKYLLEVIKDEKIKGLILIALIITLLNLIVFLMNYIRNMVTTKFTLKIKTNLKLLLHEHILKLEYQSYQTYDKAEMIQRVNDDSEVYSNFFNKFFNLVLDLLTLSYFIIKKGIVLNIPITIYIILTSFIMLIFTVWYYKRLNKSLESLISKKKELLKTTINNINNYKLIRVFNKQRDEIEKYNKLNEQSKNEDVKLIKLILFYEIINDHITYIKTPIIYLIGGLAIMNEEMTFGSLEALTIFAERIFDGLLQIGANLETIDTFHVVTKKINDLMKLKEEGNIYFNYHNSRQLNKENIREYVDYVSGDAEMFSGTIKENLQLDKSYQRAKLMQVSKEAEILEDIENFDTKFDTCIGEKGVKLSGGQKQRILIARALLRNKPIIIFDNVFNKLDNQTREIILKNIQEKYIDKTIIFITHDKNIFQKVDKIIDLEEQKILLKGKNI